MSAFTIASRCRYVATLVLVVLAIPTESATTQSIRRAFDDFDPSIDESQWSSTQGVTTAASNCGQTALSGNALYFDGIEERQAPNQADIVEYRLARRWNQWIAKLTENGPADTQFKDKQDQNEAVDATFGRPARESEFHALAPLDLA